MPYVYMLELGLSFTFQFHIISTAADKANASGQKLQGILYEDRIIRMRRLVHGV